MVLACDLPATPKQHRSALASLRSWIDVHAAEDVIPLLSNAHAETRALCASPRVFIIHISTCGGGFKACSR